MQTTAHIPGLNSPIQIKVPQMLCFNCLKLWFWPPSCFFINPTMWSLKIYSSCSLFFLRFSLLFLGFVACFSLEFYKGRISNKYPPNILQPFQSPTLEDLLCFGPCRRHRQLPCDGAASGGGGNKGVGPPRDWFLSAPGKKARSIRRL